MRFGWNVGERDGNGVVTIGTEVRANNPTANSDRRPVDDVDQQVERFSGRQIEGPYEQTATTGQRLEGEHGTLRSGGEHEHGHPESTGAGIAATLKVLFHRKVM